MNKILGYMWSKSKNASVRRKLTAKYSFKKKKEEQDRYNPLIVMATPILQNSSAKKRPYSVIQIIKLSLVA